MRTEVDYFAFVPDQEGNRGPVRGVTLTSDFDFYLPGLLSELNTLEGLIGWIQIRADGQPDMLFTDALWPAVQNLCFDALSRLLAKQSAVVPAFTGSRELHLTPVDRNTISIEYGGPPPFLVNYPVAFSSVSPKALVPLDEAVYALFECGQRFVSLLKRVHRSGSLVPGLKEQISYLSEAATSAEETLQSWIGT